MIDNFKNRAQDWDKGVTRVNGAKTIANAIVKNIELQKHMELMDFGVGTGLLGFEILPHVSKILGVDLSQKMLETLSNKNTATKYIEPRNVDIIKNPLQDTFHGIISSMTLHHVQNIELFFKSIYKNLDTNGFIAIADLEKEDGTFHSNNTGVFHFGFEEDLLLDIVKRSGFKDVKIENINTINKDHRDFGVFLLTARKE